MNKEEREDALEAAIRRRTVKGWAFKDLPLTERCQIEAFLDGGPVPPGYERRYQLECQIAREKPGTGRKPEPEPVPPPRFSEVEMHESRQSAYDRGYYDARKRKPPVSGYENDERASREYVAHRVLAYFTGYGDGKFANETGRVPGRADREVTP